MRRLVLASRNKGKIRELAELLAGLPVEVVGLEAYPEAPDVAETGSTFTENAFLKARAIAAHSGELTLADDSGLEVDALHGAPGVYSARYGEPGWNDEQRYRHLLTKLQEVHEPPRSARFRAVVVLYDPQTDTVAEAAGAVEGRIIAEPRGVNGFGYDPVFYLPEFGCTMAELPETQKNQISHRARAVRQIMPKLLEYLESK